MNQSINCNSTNSNTLKITLFNLYKDFQRSVLKLIVFINDLFDKIVFKFEFRHQLEVSVTEQPVQS